jgi:hypothetical protein
VIGEQAPRIRRQPVPDDAHLIVRGDEDRGVQERTARAFLRRYPSWGRYGLSGYYATGAEDVDLLCRVELVRFPFVVVLVRARLEEALEVVPTGHRPHVTLASSDLDALLASVAASTDRRANPYHVSERS